MELKAVQVERDRLEKDNERMRRELHMIHNTDHAYAQVCVICTCVYVCIYTYRDGSFGECNIGWVVGYLS